MDYQQRLLKGFRAKHGFDLDDEDSWPTAESPAQVVDSSALRVLEAFYAASTASHRLSREPSHV